MKMDEKRKKIQRDYRKKMWNRKSNRRETFEVLIIAILIFLVFVLNTLFKGF